MLLDTTLFQNQKKKNVPLLNMWHVDNLSTSIDLAASHQAATTLQNAVTLQAATTLQNAATLQAATLMTVRNHITQRTRVTINHPSILATPMAMNHLITAILMTTDHMNLVTITSHPIIAEKNHAQMFTPPNILRASHLTTPDQSRIVNVQ